MAQSSRLTAYFALGMQWSAPPQAARADQGGRVLDVKAQRVSADASAQKKIEPPRQAINVFLPVTTYAPQGHGVRLVQSGPNLGQNFETWA